MHKVQDLQVGVVKIYVATMEGLKKKEKIYVATMEGLKKKER
jgi:hypothetical protein